MARKGGAARPSAALPDLVYPVRAGENEELRYSLRSIVANADGLFRKVWIVGTGLPSWLTGVEVLEAGADGGRVADVRAKITAAAKHRGVASRFVLLNDDHFLVDPISKWEAFHMGPTTVYLKHLETLDPPLTPRNNKWVRTVAATAEWMAEQGHGDILCRQGHRPLLWDKRKLSKALAEYPDDHELDVLGLYDLAGAGGVGRLGGNAKIINDPAAFHAKLAELDIPWLSSNDRSFSEGMIGGYIRGMFREPSKFEK